MNQKVKAEKEEKAAHRRHQRVWNFFWYCTAPFFKLIYSYKCKIAPKIDGPYLVISNHTTELDCVLVGMSFKKQMYYVASEHVYRKGWVSKLLRWSFEPIAKIKGSSDTLTVMKIIRKLRNGYNVCLFAEGNRSFDGRNFPISEATGKLAKICGASLVTYRLEGGYLTNPRWGFGIRRGKAYGQIVNIYSPDKLAAMSVEEVTQAVVNDITEDAYERQAINPVAYKGKNRALGIECAYCVCPRCRTLGKITSKGNKVLCTSCGNETEFDVYGNFDPAFGVSNPKEWEDLQEEYLKKLAAADREEAAPFFTDSDVCLKTVDSEHNEKNLGSGRMSLYKNRFEFTPVNGQPLSLCINDIPDMSVYSRNGFVFSDSAGTHYEIKPIEKKSPLNVRKYISIWKIRRSLSLSKGPKE
ncbi:MAG: 1-acyl-sn-glycerol-3-phosphate acyltransferase [Treponema sp.]|nr:1-acyl-sn-glycerol-3-phosphate acyltransferase [Treponema sp.]